MSHIWKVGFALWFAVAGFAPAQAVAGSTPALALRLVTPAGYLPGLPLLARVELRHADGSMAREVWDAEAALSTATPGVTLSTNRVLLYNGMGSILVTPGGSNDFSLTATVGPLSATRAIQSLGSAVVTSVGGALPAGSNFWSGVVRVTNDVTVPAGASLTIAAGAWVIINGVSSGTAANDLLVSGTINSLGTEAQPVTITCANAGLRWGQIRHNTAQPSLYRHTIITLAGRAPGEGHTGQAPVLRPTASTITFDGCSITDHATAAGTPGKIMQSASGSTITMTNCLLARARMGPEISGTALQFLDSYIIDMRGPDDADGIYLHGQGAGQTIRFSGAVVAGGDDDGIDTLGSTITVEDSVVRGWKFPGDDSKGISVFGGEARLWRCLLVDNTIGISGKAGTGESLRIRMDRCTILGNSYGVALTNKSGTTPVPDYRITNCVIRAPVAVFTSYPVSIANDFHFDYCNLSAPWSINGAGNFTDDPQFVDAAVNDFRLAYFSPCIDTGDPASPLNPDGSRVDVGYHTFCPPPPVLSEPRRLPDGSFEFILSAYTNRNYVVEVSTNCRAWRTLTTVTQTNAYWLFNDASATNDHQRYFKARLAP